ncbi:hypothetical protein CERSUDRAFT_94250 [Gelatoporia subvermispora B]|uniref:Uncharacterized protein n=1 Tax=Ceriporiopsis subvermispora (strain B) TaxID=914234 RepID=M2REH8_CERS8|nr:hypothetical protein CERSUDRAFT_94250 [Gelatoporia subvermispora B]
MGRKSKYPDDEARRVARKLQKARYNQKEQARSFRREQNHRAYLRHKAQASSPFLAWNPPTLPTMLLEMACEYFIIQEGSDGDTVNTHLGIWGTPYAICLPAKHAMKSMREDPQWMEKLNFDQWGRMIAAGLERVRIAEEQDDAKLASAIEVELEDRLDRWRDDWKHMGQHEVNTSVVKVALRWGAKIIAALYKDLEVCRGEDSYCDAYKKGLLAWQNLNWLRIEALETVLAVWIE